MQISDLLDQMGGTQALARELGLSPQQAQTGATALLPAILGGFGRQAGTQAGGTDALGSLLERLGGGGLLDNVLSPKPTDVGLGNNVLGEIFGGKDVSRAVAADAANRSGLDASMLKKMLPILAMLAAGYLARQHTRGSASSSGGGLGGLLGGLLGGRSGGGNPLEDIIGMMAGTRRG